MKYIVYLTRNKKSSVNGLNRIYVGVHKTENPEVFDGYIGCGVYIQQPATYMYPKTPFQRAVKKYGVDAFERITLYVFDTEEQAYNKEKEIVDIQFIKQSHVYNACLGGICTGTYGKLYQFDLTGKLVKVWEYSKEAYEFYGYPIEKFNYAVFDKHPLVNFLWSHQETIDVSEYTTQPWGEPKVTHLYNKEGKWLGEFFSRKECAEYIGTSEATVSKAVLQASLLLKQYYVSDSQVDLYIPKVRNQYIKTMIYVYDKESNLLGQGIGKEIMPIIDTHSWHKINDAFRYKQGWYNGFYLSLEPIDKVPVRNLKNKIKVDIYDKYGNFIETLDTLKEVKEKYKVPSSKIKNLEQGNRYYGDFIFKYNRELGK